MIPQANLVLVLHEHAQRTRVGIGVGVPGLNAKDIGDTKIVHLVGAPVAAHSRANVGQGALVDLEPAGHLHNRFNRILVEVGQALLRTDNPRHAMNVDVQVGVVRKLCVEHHIGQIPKTLIAQPPPVVGHLRVAGDENTGVTARVGVLAKHRTHDGRRMGINKAVRGRVINIRRNLQQPVHLRRVGVHWENLDATRNAIGRIEQCLILANRKERMLQPITTVTTNADVRIHHLAADEPGRVNALADRVGHRSRHYAGPEHRVSSAVYELVGSPVGLRVVSREPVVGVIDVQLAAQRRLRVHAHLAQEPVVGTAVVGVKPLANSN